MTSVKNLVRQFPSAWNIPTEAADSENKTVWEHQDCSEMSPLPGLSSQAVCELNTGTICTYFVVHERKDNPLYLKFQDHKSLQKDAVLEE